MMKTHLIGALCLCGLIAAALPGRAQAPAAPAAAPRELKIVVVEELQRGRGRIYDYNVIASVFKDVFEARKWPYTITVERFASNTSDDDTQLRIFFQGIFKDTPDEVTFHAWMTFYDRGVKTDFGLIRSRYAPHTLLQKEDVVELVVRGAAIEAADKIESVLKPKPAAKKP
jgi:hypothetical protein